MEIRQARLEDIDKVLKILDEFNDYANSLNEDWDGVTTSFSRENSGGMFEEIIKSKRSELFVALEDDKAVGFLEVHMVPRLRKANYYGEIESMFVTEEYRGSGAAKALMEAAIEWGKEQKLNCLRLYSGHELKRAHAFYEKMGFEHAGRTYKYSVLR